jgi:hypothetical protein
LVFYGPNNENLGGSGWTGNFEVTLGQTGTYVVVWDGASENAVGYETEVVRRGHWKWSWCWGSG